MLPNLQPHLKSDLVTLRPLANHDFEALYQVANDPLIWEQHPNKDRYQRKVFEKFFKGAMESKGALLILDTKTQNIIGSSRYYDFDLEKKTVAIGYTFLARKYWGTDYNKNLKLLMINHAFTLVNDIFFHIGASNIRSQKAIEKLGAIKVLEKNIAYYGEAEKLNYIYQISIKTWVSKP